MATDTKKLALGVVALVVSSIAILATGFVEAPIPDATAAVAALGLAVGAILVGLSEDGAGV